MATSWERVGRLVAGVIALAAGLATLAPGSGGSLTTTYMERSAQAETLFVATGLGLVLAGMIGWFNRPGWRIADLAVVAGFLWFAPAWVGWDVGPPLVRGVGMVASAFLFPVIAHLVLAFPSGRLHPRAVRVAVTLGYLGAGLFVLGTALFWDPFFDTGCWSNCTDNVFLVHSLPSLADAIQVAGLWFLIVFATALVGICTWRIINNSGQARRVLAPVVGPGMLVAAAVIAHSIAVLRVPVEDPADPVFFRIFVAGCVSALLLAAGLVFDVSEPWHSVTPWPGSQPAWMRRPRRDRSSRRWLARLATPTCGSRTGCQIPVDTSTRLVGSFPIPSQRRVR